MNRFAQIWPRLRQLVLMLSSSQDGEVVNAARAIGRALQNVGADWHDLVAGLSGLSTSGGPQPKGQHETHRDTRDWHVMHDACLRHLNRLRPRELEFVLSLKEWRGDLTEKQFVWLESIYARIRRTA
jgi:hypothetical protein